MSRREYEDVVDIYYPKTHKIKYYEDILQSLKIRVERVEQLLKELKGESE